MMQPRDVQSVLAIRPFVPLRLTKMDGTSIEINFSHAAVVMKHGLLVFRGVKSATGRSADRYDLIAFDRIFEIKPRGSDGKLTDRNIMAKLKILDKTPTALGYTFPSEWARHAGTWFSWPRPEGISFPGKYHTVPENLARIIREIQSREAVHINVLNDNWAHLVGEQLKQHGCPIRNVHFHFIKTNESWCRDHGPAFVTNGKRLAVVDWAFNAWGGKYPPYDDDDNVPTRIAEEFKLPVFYPKIVMEGGSVEFNGTGTVMSTTDCLLNQNRNPNLSREQIEQYLKNYYGQQHVCWLTGGIRGDDTDGHIDDLARFISPTKLVIAVEPDAKDANYRVLRSARRQVETLVDQDRRPFEIIEIPMPKPVIHDGERLPATYINFYFVNGALLVPTYRDKKNDRKALQILQSHLPRHKVIGIDCTELIWGLGAIHCLTQQMPAV